MAKTILVSTSAELYQALKSATGGETVLLKAGNYGSLSLGAKSDFDITFPATVTIASADAAKPAVFTGLALSGAANLAIRNVTFDYTYKAGDIDDFRPFEIRNGSSNIAITGSTFAGDVASGLSETANGFGRGNGLSVRDSANVTVSGNEFFSWKRGLVVANTGNVTVTNNEVHDIRSDGMNFAAVQNVRIEGNYFHDFRASYAAGDHRDMIQFWTTGTTKPSTDIVIRNNRLDIGEGSYTQSIFMRNEAVDTGLAGTEMYYRNVLIENNTIYNGHLHGITVGATAGLTIRNNSVLAVSDENNPDQSSSAVWVPTIRVAAAATKVVIEANAVAEITGPAGQAGWVVRNNALVQNSDPFKAGHYSDVFIDSTLDAENGVHNFVARPGSLIETLGAGAASTRLAAAGASTDAFFEVAADAQNGATRIFDASFMAQLLGTADQTADYHWSFGDGTTASGKVVSHAFTTAGSYDVALVVRLADGSLRRGDADVGIQGSKLLAFDGQKGAFLAYDLGVARTLDPVARLDGQAIQLGGAGTAVTVSRGEVRELRGSSDFAIDFTLKGDAAGGAGELFRQHEFFVATMGSTGQLSFQIVTPGGQTTTLTTSGLKLNDGQAHDLSIRFKDGDLQIWADGAMNAKRAIAGTLNTVGSTDLLFGNPWGRQNYAGELSKFAINIDVGDYPAQPQTRVLVADAVGDSGRGDLLALPDSGMHDASWTGRVIDLAGLPAEALIDDAYVVSGPEGAVLVLDGDGDFARLGRQTAYETADRLGFSVDFRRDIADGSTDRLIWNHMRVGLTLAGDGLAVQVATLDQGFKSFGARNIGLNDTDLHRAEVMIDTLADRLQVVVDGQVVIDVDNADFDLEAAGLRQYGWTIGTGNRFFDGAVHDVRLGDRFDFLEDYVPAPNALLS
jgi:parallel beta-helix repeat protein